MVFKGRHYETGEPVEIEIEKGLINYIKPFPCQKTNLFIGPGLVDLQINGFKGIDFNETGIVVDDIIKITQNLWAEGITNYFPTLITNSDKNISAAIETILKACGQDKNIDQTIGGIHLEGPFLSVEDGPRGAHPLKYVKPPNWNLIQKWQEVAEGKIKMITLAPEWPESVPFIKKCLASGICVAIGHTAANPDQIKNAVRAGALASTHLGNAAHLMLPRHPNYIWEQLASDVLWSTLIADGFHLPKSVLKVFLKVKPENTILISDSTKFAGLPPGRYSSHIGGDVQLDENGRLFMKNSPKMLAGSAQSLRWCIDYLANSGIVSLDTAIDMASIKPLELIGSGASYGMEKGKKADLILFERKAGKIEIIQTIKAGKLMYSNNAKKPLNKKSR